MTNEFPEYQVRAAAVGVTLTQMASGEYRLQQPRSDWPIVTADWSFVTGWIARRERERERPWQRREGERE